MRDSLNNLIKLIVYCHNILQRNHFKKKSTKTFTNLCDWIWLPNFFQSDKHNELNLNRSLNAVVFLLVLFEYNLVWRSNKRRLILNEIRTLEIKPSTKSKFILHKTHKHTTYTQALRVKSKSFFFLPISFFLLPFFFCMLYDFVYMCNHVYSAHI